MKRVFSLVLCILLVFVSVSAFAAVDEEWQRVSPEGQVKQTDNGISFSGKGNSFVYGFVHNKKVDVNGFSAEFTLDKYGDFNGKDGLDTWYGLFLGKDAKWFDSTPSMIVLLRPMEDEKVRVEVLKMSENMEFGFVAGENSDISVKDIIKADIKKDGGKWMLSLNEGKFMLDISPLASVFDAAGGKMHTVIGATNTKNQEMAFTLRKLSGESYTVVKETAAEPTENTAAKVEDKETKAGDTATATADSKKTTNPKTGDAGILIFGVMAIVSAAAFKLKK